MHYILEEKKVIAHIQWMWLRPAKVTIALAKGDRLDPCHGICVRGRFRLLRQLIMYVIGYQFYYSSKHGNPVILKRKIIEEVFTRHE